MPRAPLEAWSIAGRLESDSSNRTGESGGIAKIPSPTEDDMEAKGLFGVDTGPLQAGTAVPEATVILYILM